MVGQYLSEENTQLVELLADANQPFAVVEKKLKELIPTSRYSAAALEIQSIARGFLRSSEACGLIGCVFAADLLKRAGCVEAKGAFFDVVVEVEKAIRKDMFLMEQIKYASKDAKDAKKAAVAGQAEEYRLHTAVKVFAFRVLANEVSADEKPVAALSLTQETLDASLDVWEKDSVKLKEPLADLTHYWSAERNKNSCGLLFGTAAVVGSAEEVGTAMVARVTGAKLPSMAVSTGELQCLLTGTQPYFVLDAKPSLEESRAVIALLDSAKVAPLAKPEQSTLLKSLGTADVSGLGVTAESACQIAAQNPDVCAALLLKLPSATSAAFVDKMIASDIPEPNVENILLHASKILTKENLASYVSRKVSQCKGKTLTATDKETLKGFSMVLHQLVTKASIENKALALPAESKSELEAIFTACETPEVISRWEEMKK